QLASAILFARRRRYAQRGRYGPLSSEHGFYPRGLSRVTGKAVQRGTSDEERRLVVDRTRTSRKGENDANSFDSGNVGESGSSAQASDDLLCGSDAAKRRRAARFAQQWNQPIFSSVELQRLHLLLDFGVGRS